MSTDSAFVIRNQFGQYLDKRSGWQSGKDAQVLFRASFRDEALNTLLETNSKDISLRGEIVEVPVDEKLRPIVEVSETAVALDQALAANRSAENGKEAEGTEEESVESNDRQ